MGKIIARVLGALLLLGGLGMLGVTYQSQGLETFVDCLRRGERGLPIFILAAVAGVILIVASLRGAATQK
jgi:hypothetical protein